MAELDPDGFQRDSFPADGELSGDPRRWFFAEKQGFFLLPTPHKLRLLNQNIYVFLKSQLLPFPTVKLLSSTQGLTLGRVTGSLQMPAL